MTMIYRNQYHGALSASVDGLDGPSGDWDADTTTLQSYFTACLNTGQAIVIPPGDWHVIRPLTYTFDASDHGPLILGYGTQSSRIYNETDSEYVIDIRQSASNRFSLGGGIYDVGIYGPAANRVNEGGIRLRGVWHFTIARCRFRYAKRHHILMDTDGTDATSVSDLLIDRCQFLNCDTWAIQNGTTNPVRGGGVIRGCSFSQNDGCARGGFYILEDSTMAYTTNASNPQVLFDTNVGTHQGAIIRGNLFEGGQGGELEIRNSVSVTIEGNRFAGTYVNSTPSSSFGIKVGPSGSAASSVYIKNNAFTYDRYADGLTSFTAVKLDVDSSSCRVTGTSFISLNAAYAKYENDGGYNVIEEDGSYYKPTAYSVQADTNVSSGETYTPNLETIGSYYRLNITSVSPSKPTIANPSGMDASAESAFPVYVTILNQTGGNIDPSSDITWGGDWSPLSTTLNNNRWAVAQFIWDPVNTIFFQVAAWAIH